MAIDDDSLVVRYTARRYSGLGRLPKGCHPAASDQAHWTPEPGQPRSMNELCSELGSIRFARIVGPDWLAEYCILDCRAIGKTKQGSI